MSHQPFFDWMQLALDGDLKPEQHVQLDAHLLSCAQCAALWQTLAEVETLFSEAPVVSPRPGFTGRFNARLKQQHSQPRALWGVFVLGLSVVSTAAVVLPLTLGVLWPLVQLLGQPATSVALFDNASAISQTLFTVGAALWAAARALGEFAAGTPLVWLVTLGILLATALWVFAIRRLALQGLML
jgi:predicted anti-sigma-YlaC factor YlaD